MDHHRTSFTSRPSSYSPTERLSTAEDELFMMKVLASRMDPEDRKSEQNTRAIRNATIEAEAARGIAPFPQERSSSPLGRRGSRRRSDSFQTDYGGLGNNSRRGSSHSLGNPRRNSYNQNYLYPGGSHHYYGVSRRQSEREEILRGDFLPSMDDGIQDLNHTTTTEYSEDPVIIKILAERNRQVGTSSPRAAANPQQYTPRVPSTECDHPYPNHPNSSYRDDTNQAYDDDAPPHASTPSNGPGHEIDDGGTTTTTTNNNNNSNSNTEIENMDAKFQRSYRSVFRESQAFTPGAFASTPIPITPATDSTPTPIPITPATDTNNTSNNEEEHSSNQVVTAQPNRSDRSITIEDRETRTTRTTTAEVRTSHSSSMDLTTSTTRSTDGNGGKMRRTCRTGLIGMIVGIVIVLVSIVVGVVLGLVVLPSDGDNDPSPDIPQLSLEESISLFHNSLPSSTKQALMDPTSSQSIAFEFTTFTSINGKAFTDVPLWKQQQRFALAVVYHELYDDLPPSNEDECRWLKTLKTSRACSFSSGHYEKLELELSETPIAGLPLEVGLLQNLLELTITGTIKENSTLTDWVPREVVQSTPLVQTLELESLQLAGNIPSYLQDWGSLNNIQLTENALTGAIPSEVGLLSNLVFLRWKANDLTGRIPSELGLLSNLVQLRLSSNQLTGEIPSELGNLVENIEVLDLENNKNITGMIPTKLCSGSTKIFLSSGYKVDCDTVICCGEQEVVEMCLNC